MSRLWNLSRSLLHSCFVILLLAVAAPALAMPTTVTFVDNATCDPLAVPPDVDELGIGFPADELIFADDAQVALIACPSTDISATPNTMVRMSNLTAPRTSRMASSLGTGSIPRARLPRTGRSRSCEV